MEPPVDEDLLRELRSRAKKQIRARMRALRTSIPTAALAERSARLIDRLLAEPLIREARSVASFWPLIERHEVDLRPLDAELRRRGVRLYYPFQDPTVTGFRTGFRLSEREGDVIMRSGRFAEPPPDAPEAARGDVDVVLVPALAVAATGHRIGYGAGYYDATLGDVCPPARAIVVAYDFQLLAEVPAEPHDVPVQLVVTDARVLPVETEPS
ncbi:MAG TPA: 5-formyltetrahydrofolate cyclo-ligase [Polyangiaceae bacterium]|nr:5-formyltetrahydrofolate cyclo-ligase [Polyangiaceae bacterium]